MCTPIQLDHDFFRILLYGRNEKELLLERNNKGFALPSILIPRYTRVARQITEAIRKDWQLQTCCLFQVLDRAYAVELCGEISTQSTNRNWLPIHTLAEEGFSEAQDFLAIESATKIFEQYRNNETVSPFGKLGWLRDVTGWVESVAAPLGLRLTGEFQQFNASSTFSLIRFETNGSALWFKAIGEPNLHEYSLTCKLAAAFPEFLPCVVAVQPGWNAWLSVEAEGAHLTEDTSISDWQRVVSDFARLQLATFGNALHLIDAGCKDARTQVLQSHVRPFFDFAAELMDQQTKPTPAPLSRLEIQTLARDVEASLACLAASDIPNVLLHMDLNPNNVLVGKSRCVFLDWAEGAVGCPFVSFEYLREHWRKLHGANAVAEQALVSAYTKEWQSFVSPAAVEAAFGHTPLVAAFASVALNKPWQKHESSRLPSAPYLRSLARRMQREAHALQERSVMCLP
jgi:aminoglycoside phosphotransferase (APT) family kinase protein